VSGTYSTCAYEKYVFPGRRIPTRMELPPSTATRALGTLWRFCPKLLRRQEGAVDVTVAGVGQRALSMEFAFACAWDAREVLVSGDAGGQQFSKENGVNGQACHKAAIDFRVIEGRGNFLGLAVSSAGVCPPCQDLACSVHLGERLLQSRCFVTGNARSREVLRLKIFAHDLHSDSGPV
jgi:hypothetical protein